MPKMSESDSQIMKEKIINVLKWIFSSFIWLGVLLLIIDFVTKQVIVANKDAILASGGIDIIPGFLGINYVINHNFVFGISTFDPMVNRIVFCVVALTIVVVILIFIVIKWGKINKFYRACLMMIIAGAIGNVIDRIFYTPEFLGEANGVVDWIDFYGIWKFNFNIADSSVVVAAIMLIIYMIVHDAKEAIEKKKNEPKVEVDNTKVLSKTEQEKNKYLDQKQDE